jgi:hypothetical protein
MEKKQRPGPQQPRIDRKGNSSNPRSKTGTIQRDLVYLNKQAQDSLKTHVQESFPEQYQKYINGLNQVLKIG